MFSKSDHARWAAVGIALSFLFLVACGSDETPAPADKPAATQAKPPPPEIPSNVSVEERDAAGNPIRFSGTDGRGNTFEASIGDDAKVPSSFPTDVPLYPGAKTMAAMTAAGEGTMVTFKTMESQQKIYEFYQNELGEQGWKVGEEENFGGQLGLVALKDTRKVTVTISGTRGDSRISLIVMDDS
ncbi:MAG: hypothetical protein VCE43_09250 [Myxococcota bacterium]